MKKEKIYNTKDIEKKSERLIGIAWANFQEQKWILIKKVQNDKSK